MTCPVCKRPSTYECRPFCSRRCADVDLGRWMAGVYVIPTEDAEEGDSGVGGKETERKRENP